MNDGPRENSLGLAALIFVPLLFVFAVTINLESTPPLWWDEGWNLSVARNWVELGHYGRLSLGEKVPSGMEAAFPTTASIALAFKYFGVGVFQARLVIGLYSIAALALLFYLARCFYDHRIALGAVLVLLLMAGNRYVHPVFMARQVLAEVPALVFLLGGFICFLWAGQRSRVFLLGAIFFWSVAIITKAQVLPFWGLSLGVPFVCAICLRRKSLAATFAVALLGSTLLGFAWQGLIAKFLLSTSSSVSGLSQTVGLVLDPFRRFITIATTLQIGLPTLLGLVWALRDRRLGKKFETHADAVKLSYFILAGSWFAWWELASPGWPRYLFPSAFLASIFVSAMIHEWTDGFRVGVSLRNAAASLADFKLQWRDVRVIGALLLVGWSSVQTAKDLRLAFIGKTNEPLFEAVEYLNTATPSAAVVETYESELFFFLKRRYHYPPDQTPVELIRREDLGESGNLDYDVLAADPDYLVIGGWCHYYKCYDAVVRQGVFKRIKTFGPYEVFQRVRDAPTASLDSSRRILKSAKLHVEIPLSVPTQRDGGHVIERQGHSDDRGNENKPL
jgi:hypothetical protein